VLQVRTPAVDYDRREYNTGFDHVLNNANIEVTFSTYCNFFTQRHRVRAVAYIEGSRVSARPMEELGINLLLVSFTLGFLFVLGRCHYLNNSTIIILEEITTFASREGQRFQNNQTWVAGLALAAGDVAGKMLVLTTLLAHLFVGLYRVAPQNRGLTLLHSYAPILGPNVAYSH
jgi:hypothetical protein